MPQVLTVLAQKKVVTSITMVVTETETRRIFRRIVTHRTQHLLRRFQNQETD